MSIHTQIGFNASKRGPLTQVPWSRQNWNACQGLIVGGWFYWTFLAFHSGAAAAERLMTTTSPQKARAINPLS